VRVFEVDGEEHEGFLVGVDVVLDVFGEDEDLAGGEGVGLALGADGEVAFEDVDGDGAVGEVFGEAGALAEVDEGDGGVAEAFVGCVGGGVGRGGGFGDVVGARGALDYPLEGLREAHFGVGAEAVGVVGSGIGHGEAS
jgi:hypothetical protein